MGLWIFLDLGMIALGAGAFFTGFLVYILKREELKPILNTAVVVGFICYSGAVAILMVDVGQPLRAWFTFWHPNTHSMLTEVTFCITCYLLVLCLEYIPIFCATANCASCPRSWFSNTNCTSWCRCWPGWERFFPSFTRDRWAGFTACLRGRPFAFRKGFFIWPSTFFLFILSAIATGPSFLMLITATVEKVTGRTLVPRDVFRRLGFISGVLLGVYVAAKSIDTLVWLNFTSPSVGFPAWQFYSFKPFGTPVLFAEIVLLGLVPAILLTLPWTAARQGWLLTGAALACGGVLLNRFILTMQTLALPTLPFDEFLSYTPSWQEVASFAGVIAYGVIVYSLSYRYLHLFGEPKGGTTHVSRG